MLVIVAFGLFMAGVTIWPATWELKTLVHLVWGDAEAAFWCPFWQALFVPIRGLPSIWFWVDFAFAPGAALPLVVALRDVRRIERHRTAQHPSN